MQLLLPHVCHIILRDIHTRAPLRRHRRRETHPRVPLQTTHGLGQEDLVDFFQAEVGCLRVIPPDDGDEEGQESHENKVCAPDDAIDQDGRYHDDEKVPDPAKGVSSVTFWGLRDCSLPVRGH